MSMDVQGIVDAVASAALVTGLFEQVNGHEPQSAPTVGGLTCAAWADKIGPVPGNSGLAITSALVTMNVRLYTSVLSQPYDGIDPDLMRATNTLMAGYTGDFDLGGQVESVDLLGMTGTPMSAQAGYLEQDGNVYRVMTITLPLVIADVWEQVE